MITFFPGESKIAIIPLTIKPVALDCQVEIYIGPNEQTKTYSSGLINFVSTGQQQNLSLTVVMPEQEGVYHVYIDTYVGGVYLAGYISNEDIAISADLPAFNFGTVSGRYYNCPGSTWNTIDFYCRITNNTDVVATHAISWMWTYSGTGDHVKHTFSLTLYPGESYFFNWVGPDHGPSDGCDPVLAPNRSFSFWLQDEMGNRSGVL